MTSCACEGWWEQDLLGVQPMEDLVLSFAEGRVWGSGSDIVGDFELEGTIREGVVNIRKSYVDQHHLAYVGQFDGEGGMQGTWHILGQTGRWAIRLTPHRPDRGGKLQASVDTKIH